MFAQNKTIQLLQIWFYSFSFPLRLRITNYLCSTMIACLFRVRCRQLHIREISESFWVEMRDRTLAKFDKMISQDCLGWDLQGCWGGRNGIMRMAASVVREKRAATEGKVQEHDCEPVLFSHGLKLIDALLCVALPNLTQRFVFVSACFHILGVEDVVLCLLGFISGLGQLWT